MDKERATNQIGIKGKVIKLQTSIKQNDTGELEAVFKISSTDVTPIDLLRLFQAQQAGNLEFTIRSQQLELFSSEGSKSIVLPVN